MPIGLSKCEHYNSFGKVLLKHRPVKIEISAEALPILSFCHNYKRNTEVMPLTGPYTSGYLKGIPVTLNTELSNTVNLTSGKGRKVTYELIYKNPAEEVTT